MPPKPVRGLTLKTWKPACAKRARNSSAVAAVCTCSCTRPRSSANLMMNSAMPLPAGVLLRLFRGFLLRIQVTSFGPFCPQPIDAKAEGSAQM